jgi:hypothetical protein
MSAEKLREAAKVERAEWSGDVGGKFDKAARIHLALADWLDAEAYRISRTIDGGTGRTWHEAHPASLAVADAILGGAS